MVRAQPFWRGAIVAALGLGVLAGCQHGAPRGNPGALLSDSRETPPRLKPNQVADVQMALGRSAEQRGDLAQAAAFYQQTLKQDLDRADAWHRLAVVHDRQGKFRESAEMYRKALAARPGDPAVFCDIGYSCYLQGRFAEATMNLRQAIVLQPDNSRAHNNLGLVLARCGQEVEALAEFRKGGCNEADA